MEKAIITAASDKYFPSLINLLGSVKANYPAHPKIYVYDLGLSRLFLKELEHVENLEILKMPPFVSFWRDYYTWKTYIFTHPLARLNFYMDAGCEVEGSLDGIFDLINKDKIFAINQEGQFSDLVPSEYYQIFQLPRDYDSLPTIHAGEFGFQNSSEIKLLLEEVYEKALAGLALGFSPQEGWRKTGKPKLDIVRDCSLFRHDMTLLNIVFRRHWGSQVKLYKQEVYASGDKRKHNPLIVNLRLGYKWLPYLSPHYLHADVDFTVWLNRIVIIILIIAKDIKQRFLNFGLNI